MLEILHYEFMQHAWVASILASIACGIIGTYVVVKRISFISGGISHAAFGGIGLGYFLGINPMIGAMAFGLASAVGLGIISKKMDQHEEAVIGVLWSMGMALGIIFIYLTPGYAPELMSYLFGDILMVPIIDLIMMAVLDGMIITIVYLFYKEFLAFCFDEEFCAAMGVPVYPLYLLLLCLISLTVVTLIRVVGIILVMALLIIPPSISRRFTHHLGKMMSISIALGMVFTTLGLWISYQFSLPSGATIILVAGIVFLLVAFMPQRIFLVKLKLLIGHFTGKTYLNKK